MSPHRADESQDRTPSSESDRNLHAAVESEKTSLQEAPSLSEDGPEVHRETDDGATADAMLTASQIADSRGLTPRLRSLDADTEPNRP